VSRRVHEHRKAPGAEPPDEALAGPPPRSRPPALVLESGAHPAAAPTAPRIFIVHAPEDRAFVEGFLLPALALPAADLLLSSRLTPGEPLVDELVRGAAGTVTLLVLTPAFFECPWARFAEQLAQHADLERSGDDAGDRGPSLIPLLVATCDVPLATRFRVSLDFRDADRARWETHAARLRAQLTLPSAAGDAAPDVPCPYPGMRPFTAEEVAAFHGRRRELDDLLARLRAGERELYVIGPSGSGKSSLVFAGLVPALQKAALAGGAHAVRAMRPGADPMAALAFVLSGAPDSPDFLDALLAQHPGAERVVLVIDQLEELFTIASPPARAAFFAAGARLRQEPRLTLIFTMRADFYGSLMVSPWWNDLDGQLSRVDIAPLRGPALRAAIEAPAAAAKIFFEPALLERLLHDAADEPGTLPLLQETLVVLWHQRARNLLRLADYLAIGNEAHTGLAVTLARRADSALRALDPVRHAIARRVFLRLVQFGAGRADTRRQQPREAFLTAADPPALVDNVLAYLVEHRLITASQAIGPGAVFDLSHEILLSAWPTLREWITAERGVEQRRRLLETKAQEWAAAGRGAGGLLDSAELASALRWAGQDRGLSPDAVALIERSSRRQLALRWLATSAFILLFLGLVLIAVLWTFARQTAGEAYRKSIEADEQRQLARIRLGQSYQESARKLLVDDDRPLQALPYLYEARRLAGDNPALSTLFAAAARSAPLARPLHHRDAVTAIQFSPDGARLLTASADGTAGLWDATTGAPLLAPLPHRAALRAAAFSPDGVLVATAGDDHTARLWSSHTGHPAGAPLTHRAAVSSVAFSPDGTRVVTASDDSTARLWDAQTGQPLGAPLDHRGWVTCAAFSPDGELVVTASRDHTARVWDARTGQPRSPPLRHDGAVRCAAFSPDGARVVTAGEDHAARIWDARTGEPLVGPLSHQGIVERAVFSADGARVATASWDASARVWDARTGEPLTPPLHHDALVFAVAFSPDDALLATASEDGTARLWDPRTGAASLPRLEHQRPVRAIAFRRDGARLATASDDSTASIWRARGRAPCPPLHHDAAVVAASLAGGARDRRLLLALDDGTSATWDLASCALVPDAPPVPRQPPAPNDPAVPIPTADGTRFLLRGPDEDTATLWSSATKRQLGDRLQHRDRINTAAFSPDGNLVATAGQDRVARIWHAFTGAPLTPPLEHRGAVRALAFSPDGARLATASDDRTARLWDAQTGQPLTAPLLHDTAVASLAFSADGAVLATIGADATVRLWDTSLDLGDLEAWQRLVAKSPYQLQRGVLILRASAPAASPTSAADEP
jgi:WD40 repeat protein